MDLVVIVLSGKQDDYDFDGFYEALLRCFDQKESLGG